MWRYPAASFLSRSESSSRLHSFYFSAYLWRPSLFSHTDLLFPFLSVSLNLSFFSSLIAYSFKAERGGVVNCDTCSVSFLLRFNNNAFTRDTNSHSPESKIYARHSPVYVHYLVYNAFKAGGIISNVRELDNKRKRSLRRVIVQHKPTLFVFLWMRRSQKGAMNGSPQQRWLSVSE